MAAEWGYLKMGMTSFLTQYKYITYITYQIFDKIKRRQKNGLQENHQAFYVQESNYRQNNSTDWSPNDVKMQYNGHHKPNQSDIRNHTC